MFDSSIKLSIGVSKSYGWFDDSNIDSSRFCTSKFCSSKFVESICWTLLSIGPNEGCDNVASWIFKGESTSGVNSVVYSKLCGINIELYCSGDSGELNSLKSLISSNPSFITFKLLRVVVSWLGIFKSNKGASNSPFSIGELNKSSTFKSFKAVGWSSILYLPALPTSKPSPSELIDTSFVYPILCAESDNPLAASIFSFSNNNDALFNISSATWCLIGFLTSLSWYLANTT